MEYKANPIQRGHIPRKYKKHRDLQKALLLLVLLLACVFIIIPATKDFLHKRRISDLESRCIAILERKQARISELEAILEIDE